MSNNYIQVPPQSTGLKVQTYENTVGGNTVESEAVTLTRGSDNTEVGNSSQPLFVQGTVSTATALTASSPTAATVGTSSAQALASNSSRLGLVLVNTSGNTISLGLGAAAVLNSGITLMPNGGTWVMDEYTYGTFAINAIASAGSSNLAIQELT